MTDQDDDTLSTFEPHRSFLRGLAYRMLGSRADAEDAVQDAWLRWHGADRSAVEHPRAFLAQTITRLCLDRMKSGQAQHEQYVGTWLPEPVVDDAIGFQPGPEVTCELAHELSFAFLLALERLSPLERAAFLLHDVFDVPFAEIASALGRSEAACRQLAARARDNVRESKPRFKVSDRDGDRLAAAFAHSIQQGDASALAAVLAEDAAFISDGGGKVTAVSKPVFGREVVTKLVMGLARLVDPSQIRFRAAQINGLSGFVVSDLGGNLIQTIAIQPDEAGRIAAIYVMRNPDKLKNVAP
jgi:RNA polymerase sigma-70 factor, ECF subfamily